MKGGGAAGGVGAGLALALDQHHRGVPGQMTGRGRARDPGADHNHSHPLSLPDARVPGQTVYNPPLRVGRKQRYRKR